MNIYIYIEVVQVPKWVGCPKPHMTISYGPLQMSQPHQKMIARTSMVSLLCSFSSEQLNVFLAICKTPYWGDVRRNLVHMRTSKPSEFSKVHNKAKLMGILRRWPEYKRTQHPLLNSHAFWSNTNHALNPLIF